MMMTYFGRNRFAFRSGGYRRVPVHRKPFVPTTHLDLYVLPCPTHCPLRVLIDRDDDLFWSKLFAFRSGGYRRVNRKPFIPPHTGTCAYSADCNNRIFKNHHIMFHEDKSIRLMTHYSKKYLRLSSKSYSCSVPLSHRSDWTSDVRRRRNWNRFQCLLTSQFLPTARLAAQHGSKTSLHCSIGNTTY
jgi:hypothetical protein